MAPAAEAPVLPSCRVETVWNRDKKGQPTSKQFDHVVGLPGGAPGAAGLVILKPVAGVEEREIFTEAIGGQTFFRSWRTERHFKGSKGFPEGIVLGMICHHVDTGVGVPFEENAFFQCGPDGYDRLEAYAQGRSYLGMHEKRRIAEESEQWRAEVRATGTARPGSTSPQDALQGVADDRMAKLIAAGVAAELDRRDAEAKKKGAGS